MTEVFVSPAWLDEHGDEVRIVDVRDEWEFTGIGHVPGAVNVPFDRFRADEHAAERNGGDQGGDDDPSSDGDRQDGADATGTDDAAGAGMLPGEDAVATLLGEAGIGRGDEIVAYDDTHGVFAARFLVTALLYGHPPEQLHLLDGDFSAWTREYETDDDPADATATTYGIDRPTTTPLVDRAAVEDALDDPDTVIVDTREPREYEEGHLPGAIQLDWMELVDEESRGLKPRGEIESILAEHGIDPDRRVLLYCNTARRISHTYLVLSHLGYDDLAFYEGSLTEWEATGGPIETGE